jgi:hypothetical protein
MGVGGVRFFIVAFSLSSELVLLRVHRALVTQRPGSPSLGDVMAASTTSETLAALVIGCQVTLETTTEKVR